MSLPPMPLRSKIIFGTFLTIMVLRIGLKIYDLIVPQKPTAQKLLLSLPPVETYQPEKAWALAASLLQENLPTDTHSDGLSD